MISSPHKKNNISSADELIAEITIATIKNSMIHNTQKLVFKKLNIFKKQKMFLVLATVLDRGG